MSIKNGAYVAGLFLPAAALVDSKGVPTTGYGRGLLQTIFNRTGLGTGIVPTVSPPLTATGSTIANALQLAADWNYVTTVAAASGVAIAAALNLQPGNDIWVFNYGANSLKIYPPSSSVQIDNLGVGNPYTLTVAARSRCFQCLTATQFNSYGN